MLTFFFFSVLLVVLYFALIIINQMIRRFMDRTNLKNSELSDVNEENSKYYLKSIGITIGFVISLNNCFAMETILPDIDNNIVIGKCIRI